MLFSVGDHGFSGLRGRPYGTDYFRFVWPLAPESQNHGEYREPLLAFVPSITISNLIAVSGDAFPNWRGDLLVASLRNESLYREIHSSLLRGPT